MSSKPAGAEALYHQIGLLLADTPNLLDFDAEYQLPASTIQWLSKATALVSRAAPLGTLYSARMEVAVQNLVATYRTSKNAKEVVLVLNQVLAAIEIDLPPSAKGAFVSAGDTFDAFSAVAKIIAGATRKVLIVDPYLDASVIIDFGGLVGEGVDLLLLGDEALSKPALKPAAERWIAQYGSKRPLSVRLAAPRSLHDRIIIIDDATAWILTQSLKDFAKRAHATIQRADNELTQLKVVAFSTLWDLATVLSTSS